MAFRHALEDLSEIGERLDAVELGGSDERADGRPAGIDTIRASEEVVLAVMQRSP